MEDFSAIVDELRANFKKGRSLDLKWRKQQLNQLLKMVVENQDEIADALHKDLRKPKQEAICLEVEYTANFVRNALYNIDKWVKDEYVEKNLLTLLDTTYIHRDPRGVVLIIGPWNYPFQLAVAPIVGALAAGNAVVIKPGELAPATADVIKKYVTKYLDQSLVRVILGGVPETTELLRQKFDMIFFTGSVGVGRIVAQVGSKVMLSFLTF